MTTRIMAGLLAVVLMLLQYRIWASPDGMREVWRLEQAIDVQSAENTRLETRNRTLAAEVRDLKEGRKAIEERARTDLGMVKTQRDVLPGRAARATRLGDHAGACRCGDRAEDGPGRLAVTLAVRRWAIVPAAGQGSRFGGCAPQAIHAAARTATCCPGRWPRCSPNPASTASSSRSLTAIPLAAACRNLRDPRVRRCTGGTRREHSVANGARRAGRRRPGHGLGAGARCRASLPAPLRSRTAVCARSMRDAGRRLARRSGQRHAEARSRRAARRVRPWRVTDSGARSRRRCSAMGCCCARSGSAWSATGPSRTRRRRSNAWDCGPGWSAAAPTTSR